MLSLGKFPVPNTSIIPQKTHTLQLLFLHNKSTGVGFCAHLGRIPNGFSCNAVKSQTRGGKSVVKMEEDYFDEEDDGFVGFVDEEEEYSDEGSGDDEDDDGEVLVPLNNMKKWLENKPRGFGEGKVYDTSIEDKLMEEIEQSRKAQLANINKLKNTPVSMNQHAQEKEAPKEVEDGFRVRLTNLPKKKNIHKDLKLAFKGVSGILNINPAVSGNKKTREPVCRGFAFIHFKSEKDAYRFVQNFKGQSISFGKVHKQIRCEMVNSSSVTELVETSRAPQSPLSVLAGDLDADFCSNDNSRDMKEDSASQRYESANEENLSAEMRYNGENPEKFDPSDSEWDEKINIIDQSGGESAFSSSSPVQNNKKIQVKEENVSHTRKKKKMPKLGIPGSANRLKIREKAVLSGVFSKYGANTAVADN